MRKLVAAIIVIVFMSLNVGVCFAAAPMTLFKLDDLKMTVEIPAQWLTITRYSDPNDASFNKITGDYDSLMEQYALSNIYLDSADIENGVEIVITMIPNSEIDSMGMLSKSELESFAESIISSNEFTAPYETYEIHMNDNANYIVFDTCTGAVSYPVYTRQYYTVANSMSINILMNSYGREIPADMKVVAKNVVDSIEYADNNALIHAAFIAIGAFAFAGIAAIIAVQWRKNAEGVKKELDMQGAAIAEITNPIESDNTPTSDLQNELSENDFAVLEKKERDSQENTIIEGEVRERGDDTVAGNSDDGK